MPDLERKVLSLAEAKSSDAGHGTFGGYASLFGLKDAGGDIVLPGAYAETIPQFVQNGFIALGHDWQGLPVADVAEAREDERGLYITAAFHAHPAAQDARHYVKRRLAEGKSVGLSIGYVAEETEPTPDARLLKKVHLFETSLVNVPMQRQAGVTQVKAADETKATWSTAYVNDLPDSAFAYIEGGGSKDSEGKTTPRGLRHFPHHDASGSPDLPHVRNALARIPQSDVPAAGKSKAEAHCTAHLEGSKELDAAELLAALEAFAAAPPPADLPRLSALLKRAHAVCRALDSARRRAASPHDPAALAATFRAFEALYGVPARSADRDGVPPYPHGGGR